MAMKRKQSIRQGKAVEETLEPPEQLGHLTSLWNPCSSTGRGVIVIPVLQMKEQRLRSVWKNMAPTAGVTYSKASSSSATWYDAFVIVVEYLRRDLILKRNWSHRMLMPEPSELPSLISFLQLRRKIKGKFLKS